MAIGCPFSLTDTAATKGVLFGEPRPRLPPRYSPPQYTSSSWMTPDSGLLSSRSFITCISFCLMLQAGLYETPNWRRNESAEIPVFACVIKWIARNQVVNGSFVAEKMLPLMREC